MLSARSLSVGKCSVENSVFLGFSGYGLFSAAFATITLIAPLTVFGIQHAWLKLSGSEGHLVARWMPISFKLVYICLTITLISITAWSFLGPHSSSFRNMLLGLSPIIISHIFMELVNSRFQIEQKFKSLAIWQTIPHIMRLSFVILLKKDGVRAFFF